MEKTHPKPVFLILLILLSTTIPFPSALAVDFVYNGFNSSDSLLLYGNATIQSRILTLTNDTTFSIGRALYRSKIRTKKQNSSYVYPFYTSFIFSMAPYRNILPGHGLVFIVVSKTGIDGVSSSQNLGFLNRTNDGNPNNHVFGVEFDVFKNQEFDDIDDNHVGINLNSLKSTVAHSAGYWQDDRSGAADDKSLKKLKLNNGENYQVWIDYSDSFMNVTMARVGMKRPSNPLLSVPLNLSDIFEDEMYIGFTSSTGALVERHMILAWSFSDSNISLSESLITTGLSSFVLPKGSFLRSTGFIAGITVGGFVAIALCAVLCFCLMKRQRRRARERAEMEEWELEYWPHRITYQEIEGATKGFSEENVIGVGGNGNVYKGVLPLGAEIAVKRISHENDGMREFLAEISSLGRLKHRNLVGFRGWCKREKGSFMLVYDYMENGSLDKRVFDCKPPLVEWVWQLMVEGRLVNAIDEKLRAKGEVNVEEAERVLHLGLLCAYPDPNARPTIRQVVKVLEGKSELYESECEGNAYLLQKIQAKDRWSDFSQNFGRGSHPTFEDIKQSLSSSMSLSWSNTTVEGLMLVDGEGDILWQVKSKGAHVRKWEELAL
ncbi:hypothetical protein FEM48_Zijuj01G0154400 [Ziziphus jujuba var. spinosa]|uniref:non-specific serine/threonine protein kinase n=1 Tax=Ziziphus jujuba var. spinosa TaxID=714518 RepID=A0A978W215_ZIZJJ|nr:hypothetical protein FEM48_Zijuj01G0154400 [Ziziphus jujuba var. spinosa]